MKNELFSIGPITIYGYGLMIAIGVLAAYFSATYRAKKYDLDPDKVFYVTVWAVIGGFGGAKLLYLITQLPATSGPSLLKDVQVVLWFTEESSEESLPHGSTVKWQN